MPWARRRWAETVLSEDMSRKRWDMSSSFVTKLLFLRFSFSFLCFCKELHIVLHGPI